MQIRQTVRGCYPATHINKDAADSTTFSYLIVFTAGIIDVKKFLHVAWLILNVY